MTCRPALSKPERNRPATPLVALVSLAFSPSQTPIPPDRGHGGRYLATVFNSSTTPSPGDDSLRRPMKRRRRRIRTRFVTPPCAPLLMHLATRSAPADSVATHRPHRRPTQTPAPRSRKPPVTLPDHSGALRPPSPQGGVPNRPGGLKSGSENGHTIEFQNCLGNPSAISAGGKPREGHTLCVLYPRARNRGGCNDSAAQT
eukprot:ctg_597.g301